MQREQFVLFQSLPRLSCTRQQERDSSRWECGATQEKQALRNWVWCVEREDQERRDNSNIYPQKTCMQTCLRNLFQGKDLRDTKQRYLGKLKNRELLFRWLTAVRRRECLPVMYVVGLLQTTVVSEVHLGTLYIWRLMAWSTKLDRTPEALIFKWGRNPVVDLVKLELCSTHRVLRCSLSSSLRGFSWAFFFPDTYTWMQYAKGGVQGFWLYCHLGIFQAMLLPHFYHRGKGRFPMQLGYRALTLTTNCISLLVFECLRVDFTLHSNVNGSASHACCCQYKQDPWQFWWSCASRIFASRSVREQALLRSLVGSEIQTNFAFSD